MKKISRDICLIKYRKFPLFEFEKETDKEVFYFPKFKSNYWIKLTENSNQNISTEITNLLKKLEIKELIFLSERNKPWISKFTASRVNFEPLIKTIAYFKTNKIYKKFNGGVKIKKNDFEEFILNFYTITECDGVFFDYNFTDENQNFIFYIHYSGEIKIHTLNKKTDEKFLKIIAETKFIDSMRDNTKRIK